MISALTQYIRKDVVQDRFNAVLKDKSQQFISSLLAVVSSNSDLEQCDPKLLINTSMVAAAMDLPINPNLGYAYIIPYRNKKGQSVPQFQMGYKGFIQLAMRTGEYRLLNAVEIYEGDIVRYNRITGEMVFRDGPPESDKVIGYCAYFQLNNGFEHWNYMSVKQLQDHGKRFSQSYRKGYGLWVDDFHSMALKTVLKLALSKFGYLSVEMQKGVEYDQASVTNDDAPDYIDADVKTTEIKEKSPYECAIEEKPKRTRRTKKAVEKTPDTSPSSSSETNPKKEQSSTSTKNASSDTSQMTVAKNTTSPQGTTSTTKENSEDSNQPGTETVQMKVPVEKNPHPIKGFFELPQKVQDLFNSIGIGVSLHYLEQVGLMKKGEPIDPSALTVIQHKPEVFASAAKKLWDAKVSSAKSMIDDLEF